MTIPIDKSEAYGQYFLQRFAAGEMVTGTQDGVFDILQKIGKNRCDHD